MNRDAADGEEAQDNNREATADIRDRPDQSCCRWDIDEEDEAASLPPAFPLPLDIPLSATCPGLGRSNGLSTSVTSLPGHSGHRYQHAQQHYAHNAHNGHRP
ncbi:hypothetical protein HDE_03108 [Halotydeus destructor]|nr:hypothetical protein HDE_03108 [Halotydeus destructor]